MAKLRQISMCARARSTHKVGAYEWRYRVWVRVTYGESY